MSSPSPEETVAFLQTHGVVFSELLQDLLRKKPDQPSLYILQRLCEEATARELRAAGLALTQKNNASNLLTARTLLEDMEKRVLPK